MEGSVPETLFLLFSLLEARWVQDGWKLGLEVVPSRYHNDLMRWTTMFSRRKPHNHCEYPFFKIK